MEMDYLMVLGVSRGGTTLSAAALGAHSRIAMLDEDMTGAMARVTGGKIGAVKLCVPNQVELDRRWHAVYRIGTWNGALRKSRIMNRVPRSPLSIRDHGRFGRLRHVCVLREPGAVIASIMNRENRSLAVASYRWRRAMEIFECLDRENAPAPVLLSFERLIRSPEESLRTLSARLGLEFETSMLEAPARNERYRAAEFDPARAETVSDPSLLSDLSEKDWARYRLLDEKAI